MRILIFLFLALPGWASLEAQAPRDVLLNACNDTAASVAASAAYRTGPGESRSLRAWFVIEPGACLDGALNNVVGDDVDLHFMSGSWRWPAGEGDVTYCVPASSTLQLATMPDCPPRQQARNFRRVPVAATSLRGTGGRMMGRANVRVTCEDLGAADAGLCASAPRDENGLAQLVRTLEICNTQRGDFRLMLFTPSEEGGLRARADVRLESGYCADAFRGFPLENEVYFVNVTRGPGRGGDQLCWAPDQRTASRAQGGTCPEGQQLWGAERAVFGDRVERFTAYIQG